LCTIIHDAIKFIPHVKLPLTIDAAFPHLSDPLEDMFICMAGPSYISSAYNTLTSTPCMHTLEFVPQIIQSNFHHIHFNMIDTTASILLL
jgi:hypothetical protein